MLVEGGRSRCNLYPLLYRSKHESDDLRFLSKKQVVNFRCKRIRENFVSNSQFFLKYCISKEENFCIKNEFSSKKMSGEILILNDSKTKNFISTSGRWKEIYSLESAIEKILLLKRKKKKVNLTSKWKRKLIVKRFNNPEGIR